MDLVIAAGNHLVRIDGVVFRRADFRRITIVPHEGKFDVIVWLDADWHTCVATCEQESLAVEIVARIYEVMSAF